MFTCAFLMLAQKAQYYLSEGVIPSIFSAMNSSTCLPQRIQFEKNVGPSSSMLIVRGYFNCYNKLRGPRKCAGNILIFCLNGKTIRISQSLFEV